MTVLWVIGGLLSLSAYITVMDESEVVPTVRNLIEYAVVFMLGPIIFLIFCVSLLTNIEYPVKLNAFLNTKISDVPKFFRDLIVKDEGHKE